MMVSALNNTGSNILKGQVVTRTGFVTPENVITMALANATNTQSAKVLGIASEDIANDLIGPVRISGIFAGINTAAFFVNSKAYLMINPQQRGLVVTSVFIKWLPKAYLAWEAFCLFLI